MNKAEALAKIQEIYASLPTIKCLGSCHHDCKGIMLTPLEDELIRRRKGVGIPEPHALIKRFGNATCPLLDRIRGTCTAYDLRPIICRLYGVMEPLPCPHGCQPSRWLTAREGHIIQAEVNWLGGYLTEEEYKRALAWADDPEIFPIIEARMRNQIRQSQASEQIAEIIRARERKPAKEFAAILQANAERRAD